MADGHLGKCKECSRSDTIQNRRKKVEYYRMYDRERTRLPQRIALRNEILMKQKENEPDKYKARTRANNALRDGHIKKEPCYFCGSTNDLEMHHPDYSKPLRIYWLCKTCHRKIDGMLKIGINEGEEASV